MSHRRQRTEISETSEFSEEVSEVIEETSEINEDISEEEFSEEVSEEDIDELDDIISASQLYSMCSSGEYTLNKDDIINTTIKLLNDITVNPYQNPQNPDITYDIDISGLSDDDIKAFLHLRIEINDYLNKKNINKINYINYKISEIKNMIGFNDTIITTKFVERTDKALIPEVKVIPGAVELMQSVISLENKANEHIDIMFNNPRCEIVNKQLKSTNRYGLDKFGTVIRKSLYNKKTQPYGWKYINVSGNEIPVSYFYDPVKTDEENIIHILNNQFQLQPKAFQKPSGIIYKVYNNDPVLRERLVDFLKSKNIII